MTVEKSGNYYQTASTKLQAITYYKKRGKFKIRRMAGSKWDEVLEILTESFKLRLSAVDREDFISFCADNKHIRNAVCKYLQNFKKTNAKSTTRSMANYQRGQELYDENKYECLSSYNSSIAYAAKDDHNISNMYISRSLVLDELGHASECLQDIEMALGGGYVEDFEVSLRKARCLLKLGDVNKAKDILGRSKFTEELNKICKEEEKNFKHSNDNLPQLKGGENENFTCASSYINVFSNAEKGRHVIANHAIHPGDVLFIERPFAFVLFIERPFVFCNDVCHNCCKNAVAPIFCWECIDVTYCSPQCREDYQKTMHQFECGFGDLFKSVGIAHLSLKIILKASSSLGELRKILHDIEEPENKDKILSNKSVKYKVVYNLVNNSDKYETLDLFQYSVTALLLALHLKNNTCYMSGNSTEGDLKFLAGILQRHILQLICNGHAIVDTFWNLDQKSNVYTETEEKIGTAIYPSASMMNHSCRPSVINSFYDNILVVRASKEIEKGEEVFNCYGPDARRMRRNERQEILKKQYFFTCRCDACLQKCDIQEIFTALKCPECRGAFIPTGENSQNWICVTCGKVSKISNEIIQKEVSFYSLLREAEVIADENITLRLRNFLEIWRLGREIFYKFHKDLSYTADEVARCLAISKDYRRCVLFLRCCVLSVEKRFGSFSIELAKEMKKLGDAIMRYSLDCRQNLPRETAQEGLSCYEKAGRIIGLLYGPHHKEMEEMKTSARILQETCY